MVEVQFGFDNFENQFATNTNPGPKATIDFEFEPSIRSKDKKDQDFFGNKPQSKNTDEFSGFDQFNQFDSYDTVCLK